MKKPSTAFIVDNRPTILSSMETTLKSHGFSVRCYNSATAFIPEQDSNQAGCVLVDPLRSTDVDMVLRWLHESGSLLSIVLISGLVESLSSVLNWSPSAPILQRPHGISALLLMVADGLAGSVSRQVIRERSQG